MRPGLLLLVIGCGRIAFDPLDETRGDAIIPTGPFGIPVPLSTLNSTAADDDATLTGDALEMVFDSERSSSNSDLFFVERASTTSVWPAPAVIAELVSADDEDSACLSHDGLTLTYSITTGDEDLYVSTRPDRASPWSAPTRIAEVASSSPENRLCLSANGLVGVLMSRRMGQSDLYEVRRATATGTWSTPTPIAELNTAMTEQDPWLDSSGTVIVFASNRLGGATDLYLATRPSLADPFGAPAPIAELNTAAAEEDPTFSSDLRTVVFTRGSGNARELFIATR